MTAVDTVLPVADWARVRTALTALLRAHAGAFTATVLISVLAAAAGLVSPWLLGRILDEVRTGAPLSTIDWLSAGVVGAAVAQLVLVRLARGQGMRLGERMQEQMRGELLDRILGLPAVTVERAGTGDLIARGTGDVAAVGLMLRDAAPAAAIALLEIALIVIALLVVDPVLGLCGLGGLFGIHLATRWYLRRAREAYVAQGAAASGLAEQLAASVAGARTIDALRLQAQRREACEAAIGDMRAAQERTLFLRSVLFPSVDVSTVLPVVLVVLIGFAQVDRGAASVGTVVTAALYLLALAQPVAAVLERVELLQSCAASMARVEGVAAITAPPPQSTGPATLTGERIVARGVHYAYDDGRDVLVDVDLVVEPGERLAIVGPSGAGKSTLGRLLVGGDRPRCGSITLGGVAVADVAPETRRSHVLLVTQEQHLFLGTIRDNLALAAPGAADEEIHRALEVVGATWVAELEDGLDTRVGALGAHVDAAQVQQIALARVVLADPHTVVLDEATSLLDPRTAERTEAALATVLEGRAIVTIAHRLQAARQADRVAVMSGGRLVEVGSHDDLVAAAGIYASLWASWAGDRRGSQTGLITT